jgi:hypothetical protein
MLETKISVEVNSFSLAGAIKNLRAEINDEIPEFKNTNIVCDGLNRTSVAEFKKVPLPPNLWVRPWPNHREAACLS